MASIKAEVDRRAADVLPIIRETQKAGATTLRQIAGALNARGAATARGGQSYATSVSSYRALRVPRSAEWFVTRNAFAYLCREHVLRPSPCGLRRRMPCASRLSQRQYLFVWLLCELLTLKTC